MKQWLRILVVGVGILWQAQASHLQGADIWYEHVNADTYRVWLALYRDCDGISLSTTQTLTVASSCTTSFTVTMNLVGTAQEVSPLCPASLPNSTCNGGTLPGTERYLFSALVVLPCAAPDWTFSWSTCCRNNAITNLQTPGSQSMYVEATLDNTLGPNNAPQFVNMPVPYICNGQPFLYNHGATDVDGDQLVYSLVNALGAGGTPLTYVAPYSPTYPLATTTGTFPFDPNTGQMNFTPNGVQNAVVVVKVEEYRNGRLIGTTMRDIQVVVIDCQSSPNQPVGSVQNLSTGNLTQNGGVFDILVCGSGQNIYFEFPGSDADGDNINMFSNDVNTAIPAASWTVLNNNTQNPVGVFSWTPTPADEGNNYTFTIVLQDDGCDINQITVYTVRIAVGSAVDAGPDQTYCLSLGNPVQLWATGGFNFTWTPATGLSCTNCPNPLASPSTTTTYTVTNDCGATDQVTVFVDNLQVFVTPVTDTVCQGATVNLSATWANCASCTGSNVFWSPATGLSCTNCANPTAVVMSSTDYVATIDNGVCQASDTARIIVRGGIQVQISASTTELCYDSTTGTVSPSAQLDATIVGGASNCLNFTGSYSSGPFNVDIGTGTTSTGSPTPYEGGWHDGRIQILYLASELQAAGMTAGDVITAIGFNVAVNGTTDDYNNFTIKMECTNLTQLTNTFQQLNNVVFTPKTVTIAATGWHIHQLDVPFQWDGTSNLIVEICFDNTTWSGDDQVYYTTTGFTSVTYDYADNSAGCSLNTPLTSSNRPNTRFVVRNAPWTPPTYTYTWSPATGLSCTNCSNPIATPSTTTTYTVTVSDGQCAGTADTTIRVSTVDATSNPSTCVNTGDVVQLNAVFTGTTPAPACGNYTGTYTTAPANIDIGTATTSTGTPTPYEGFWDDGRIQMLYLASELLAAGMQPGDVITEIGFNVAAKGSSQPYNNFTIKMECTNLTSLSGFQNLTNVVFTPKSVTTAVGWNMHVLDNPFRWDGSSNIIVEVCFDNTSYTNDDDVYYTATGFTSVVYDYADNDTGCILNTPFTSSNRPNTRFVVRAGTPLQVSYTWSPPTGLSCTNCQNPTATVNSSITYVVTADNGYCQAKDSVRIDICAPLPLNLLSFSAEVVEVNDVLVQWEVVNERGIAHYVVERSIDGEYFEPIATVPAQNSLQLHRYTTIDPDRAPGVSYYRLKSVEQDGLERYSNVVMVVIGAEGIVRVGSPYPNPAQQQFYLPVFSSGERSLRVQLYNILGMRLMDRVYTVRGGMEQLVIDVSQYRSGSYVLRIQTEGREHLYRIQVAR